MMDLQKIGKFISDLRKEKGLTQDQLGEKLGVTNKTVSRWETGTYLPPVDILMSLSEMYDISINEILSGKRLSELEYKNAAEENLTQALKSTSFTLKDRISYFKKKWLKEHIAIMVFIAVIIIGIIIAGILSKNFWILAASIPSLVLAHAWRNNTMMTYVEKNAFDGTGQ